ncbi:MAG: efflux RND transporter periplasmic adaptor subunit [Bacteroidota bacterium]
MTTPTTPSKPETKPPARGAGRAIAVAVIGAMLLGAGAWAIFFRRADDAEPGAAGDKRAGKSGDKQGKDNGKDHGKEASDRPVAVTTTPVAARDVPIFIDGIGNVVALQTVAVRAQVDGRLDRVAFTEGKAVRKGELLAQIDPRPFAIMRDQAAATLARDKAQLQSARLTLERFEAVRKDNLIAQQQLDEQRALVQQLEATVQSDDTQVDRAKLQLDYARIRSPIDGVTGVRQVDPGNIIRAADPTGIVVVTQLDPIAVIFTLPQDDLPRIAAQMAKGPLRVDILSRDEKTPLGTAELALIDNQINQTTASIRLKAVLPNPQRALWPNQFVKARLLLSVRKQALVAPAAAIQRGPQGTFVYVVGADQKAVVRPVKIDTIEGETAVIAAGLQPGDAVVTEGQAQLRPGARVTQKRADEPRGRRGGGGAGAADEPAKAPR